MMLAFRRLLGVLEASELLVRMRLIEIRHVRRQRLDWLNRRS